MVDSLILIDYHIQSLKGIEAFHNLIYLDCRWNKIDSLDLSKNLKLAYLDCSGTYEAHTSPTQVLYNTREFLSVPKSLIYLNAHITSFLSFNSEDLVDIESIKLSGGKYKKINLSKCSKLNEFVFFPSTSTTVCVSRLNQVTDKWSQSDKIMYQECESE